MTSSPLLIDEDSHHINSSDDESTQHDATTSLLSGKSTQAALLERKDETHWTHESHDLMEEFSGDNENANQDPATELQISSSPRRSATGQKYVKLDSIDADEANQRNWRETEAMRESSFNSPQLNVVHSLPNNFPPLFPIMFLDLVNEPINGFSRIYMTMAVLSLIANFLWIVVGLVLSNLLLVVLQTQDSLTTVPIVFYATALIVFVPVKSIIFTSIYHSGRMRNSLRDWLAMIFQSVSVGFLFVQLVLELLCGIVSMVHPPSSYTQRVLMSMMRAVLLIGNVPLLIFECVIMGMLIQKHKDNFGSLRRAWHTFHEEYIDGFWESVLLL